MTSPAALEAFFAANPDAIACELVSVRGSSPRAEGTFMLVGLGAIFGTIGGGALEYMVIDHARRLIAEGRAEEAMDVPLGPEIGQCCGGRVKVSLRHADAGLRRELMARLVAEDSSAAHVYVFGAGHVGRVLAQILSLLPVRLEVIDTRQEELDALRPDLDGNQIMEILGIPAGPLVGKAYRHLLELRMDHGPMTPEQAEAHLRAWWAEQG